jgi:hypothetical protein
MGAATAVGEALATGVLVACAALAIGAITGGCGGRGGWRARGRRDICGRRSAHSGRDAGGEADAVDGTAPVFDAVLDAVLEVGAALALMTVIDVMVGSAPVADAEAGPRDRVQCLRGGTALVVVAVRVIGGYCCQRSRSAQRCWPAALGRHCGPLGAPGWRSRSADTTAQRYGLRL